MSTSVTVQAGVLASTAARRSGGLSIDAPSRCSGVP